MSQFLANPGGFQVFAANNDSETRADWRWSKVDRQAALQPWLAGLLWPGPVLLGGGLGLGGPFVDFNDGLRAQWGIDLRMIGGQQAKKLIGTTRDSAGAVLGSCVVQGFLTATDEYIGETASDTAGYFELPTRYAGAHYLVCYKAGAPDVAGTSANNLIPT